MARKPRSDSGSSQAYSYSNSTSMPGQTPRRRATLLRELQSSTTHGETAVPKVINAAPSLEKAEMYGIDNERPTSSRIMALIGRMFMETIPQMLVVGVMLGLIFGGCCSNVRMAHDIIGERAVLIISYRSLHWRPSSSK